MYSVVFIIFALLILKSKIMHIKCPKCKNTNFCISQDTIDGVEYNVISCVIDDYIIGVYPNSDSKFKELQEKIEDLESTISDLEDRIERLER